MPCMVVNSAAAELVLNSLGGGAGRHVRLYVMQPDKNLLACVEKDGQVRGGEHITPGVQHYVAQSDIAASWPVVRRTGQTSGLLAVAAECSTQCTMVQALQEYEARGLWATRTSSSSPCDMSV